MSRRKFLYHHFQLDVGDELTLTEVKHAVVELFPELRDASFVEDTTRNQIRAVPKRTVLQNQLDIAINDRFNRVVEEAVERAERNPAPTHVVGGSAYGRTPSTMSEKEKLSRTLNHWFGHFEEKNKYPLTIGGKHAKKGGYTHLVGKRAKEVLYDDLLSVYIVQPEGEEKEYAIRASDIQKEE